MSCYNLCGIGSQHFYTVIFQKEKGGGGGGGGTYKNDWYSRLQSR